MLPKITKNTLTDLKYVLEGLLRYIAALRAPKSPLIAPTTNDMPKPDSTPMPVPFAPNPDALLPDWSIIPAAHHNVRALCDLEGLTYDQKETLAACVMVESGFKVNPKPNQNKDSKTGQVWSADYGIVQVNSYWNIGPGKPFPSIDYVISHPEECVRWMCRYFKTHGNLDDWSSYKSGEYLQWKGKV